MATFTAVRPLGPAQLTTTATDTSYTVGSGKSLVIKQIIFNNTSTSSVTVQAYVVPVSGSATTATAIVTDLSLGPKSQVIWSADIPMATGEKIQLSAGTGTVVTATVTGIEIA
jgi:type II secretory pathway predicted ATPase ExeA